MPSVTALRGEGRYQANAEARRQAERELDCAEVLLLLGRGRILHARFLAQRTGAEPFLRRIEAAQEPLR